ncbi:GntR family transcriptional regulator [Nocardia beijingensis]|uniref:GntR family transcriptional regulator n=1 Tax=Nocardia beijingensis TaxID=95162 RepID=UPI00082AAE6A|nr:GntR family transcriptional regulator [Nocardia beijingensis]
MTSRSQPPPQRRHQQLPDRVAAHVREQIMSGAMRPGDFLRMEPIAEAVGVSVTPVREGLLTLSSEGFVTLVPRRGFVVAAFSRQDVRDLFWAQSKLAGELAARAAQTATPHDLVLLRTLIAASVAASDAGDTARIIALGHEFHRAVNLLADSDRLARLLAGIVHQLPNSFYASLESDAATTASEHAELVAALERRDTHRARALAETHIADGADFVVDTLDQRGIWAE